MTNREDGNGEGKGHVHGVDCIPPHDVWSVTEVVTGLAAAIEVGSTKIEAAGPILLISAVRYNKDKVKETATFPFVIAPGQLAELAKDFLMLSVVAEDDVGEVILDDLLDGPGHGPDFTA